MRLEIGIACVLIGSLAIMLSVVPSCRAAATEKGDRTKESLELERQVRALVMDIYGVRRNSMGKFQRVHVDEKRIAQSTDRVFELAGSAPEGTDHEAIAKALSLAASSFNKAGLTDRALEVIEYTWDNFAQPDTSRGRWLCSLVFETEASIYEAQGRVDEALEAYGRTADFLVNKQAESGGMLVGDMVDGDYLLSWSNMQIKRLHLVEDHKSQEEVDWMLSDIASQFSKMAAGSSEEARDRVHGNWCSFLNQAIGQRDKAVVPDPALLTKLSENAIEASLSRIDEVSVSAVGDLFALKGRLFVRDAPSPDEWDRYLYETADAFRDRPWFGEAWASMAGAFGPIEYRTALELFLNSDWVSESDPQRAIVMQCLAGQEARLGLRREALAHYNMILERWPEEAENNLVSMSMKTYGFEEGQTVAEPLLGPDVYRDLEESLVLDDELAAGKTEVGASRTTTESANSSGEVAEGEEFAGTSEPNEGLTKSIGKTHGGRGTAYGIALLLAVIGSLVVFHLWRKRKASSSAR